MSGRLAVSAGPQVFILPSEKRSRISGRDPLGCASTAATTRSGARFKRLQTRGPPMQKPRSEEHTSELQSHLNLVCRLLLEKKKNQINHASISTQLRDRVV